MSDQPVLLDRFEPTDPPSSICHDVTTGSSPRWRARSVPAVGSLATVTVTNVARPFTYLARVLRHIHLTSDGSYAGLSIVEIEQPPSDDWTGYYRAGRVFTVEAKDMAPAAGRTAVA